MTYNEFQKVTPATMIEDVAQFIDQSPYPYPAKDLAEEYLDKAEGWLADGLSPHTYTYCRGRGSLPVIRCTEKTKAELADLLWILIGNVGEADDEAQRGKDEARDMGDSDRYGN